jgi:hypothetical protein
MRQVSLQPMAKNGVFTAKWHRFCLPWTISKNLPKPVRFASFDFCCYFFSTFRFVSNSSWL